MLDLGNTLEFINKGLVVLIPKLGDESILGNWRPITLLGNIYKILIGNIIKNLSNRLKSSLLAIVRPNQTWFVKGKSILDNIFLA
jgi:hypothetical protein